MKATRQRPAAEGALDPAVRARLVRAARGARRRAYAPYSRFPVGAAVLTADGRIYAGCNVECGSFGLSQCAERIAVHKAVSEGRRRIVAVAIVGPDRRELPPCGACRQVLREFGSPLVILARPGRPRVYRFEELLPHAFERPDGDR
ncbi:MAG: cytidine deaminase [Armatimonadota bacterium]|nr:cytidine deaminase [Armatimonadota bacterium]MDR5697195.1 cytidine deaminase [Armatimonadota bacterium]